MLVVGQPARHLKTQHGQVQHQRLRLLRQGAHMHCRNMPHWYHYSPATSAAVSKGLFFRLRFADIRQQTASQWATLMFGFQQLTHQQMQQAMHA
jgi:hypothetical protein